MGIFETFSKRQKKQKKSDQVDVYQYDTLPKSIRTQVIYIWHDAIGPFEGSGEYSPMGPPSGRYWQIIHDTLARELGISRLMDGYVDPFRDDIAASFTYERMHDYQGRTDYFVECQKYLLYADTKGALDIIDLSFHIIDTKIRSLDYHDTRFSGIKINADESIAELNHRFQEHSIGYQFEGGQLIWVNSKYIHAEAVKPAISLLQEVSFLGAENEFLRAHEHYRKGNYKEAITEALKAFESTMKAICKAHHWGCSSNDTAKQLINVMLNKQLFPPMLQDYFNALEKVMLGLATIRNKTSGHGQGVDIVEVPQYIAAYALHMAATNIVFLIEAHKAKK